MFWCVYILWNDLVSQKRNDFVNWDNMFITSHRYCFSYSFLLLLWEHFRSTPPAKFKYTVLLATVSVLYIQHCLCVFQTFWHFVNLITFFYQYLVFKGGSFGQIMPACSSWCPQSLCPYGLYAANTRVILPLCFVNYNIEDPLLPLECMLVESSTFHVKQLLAQYISIRAQYILVESINSCFRVINYYYYYKKQ